MLLAVRFTSSRSSPPERNTTHLTTFCFFGSYCCLWRDFCQPVCPFAARFTLKTTLKSHEESNLICEPFVLKTIIMNHFAFRETLCPVPLSLDRCILFKLYFYTSDEVCPILALFTHFAYTNFFICILPCGIFFLPLMIPLIGESSEFSINF